MHVKVDQQSLDNIIKTIGKIDVITQKQLGAAAKEGAKIVQKKAQQRAPVSQDGSNGNPKGFLKRNIKVRAEKSKTKGKKVYNIGVNGKALYGIFVEYGTKIVKANPFLRPAFDESKEEVRRVVLTKLGEGVDKIK